MRDGPGYFSLAIGGMAFGGPAVFMVSSFLFIALVLLAFGGLLWLAVRAGWRRIPRRPRPLRPEQTCPQELLDYWKSDSERMRRQYHRA